MFKRLTVAVAALFVLASSAFGAGTIPYSLSQQLDEFGKPLAGCKLYLIQAGTVSTPQNSYQDSGLTLVNPNPLTCDSAGRLPQFFLADGSIKVRLTKSTGVTAVTADGILVIGPSGGGGGGSPVDPTTVFQTGALMPFYGTGVRSGFVRANGRTIGSATSGATERANSDCQALFEYLWGADANLAVSGGRGASANADWVANKTIALPDWRGRALAFLDDMGNSAAGRLTATGFGTSATVLGAASTFLETRALTAGQIPSITSNRTQNIQVFPDGKSYVIGTSGVTSAQSFQGGATAVAPTSTIGDFASVGTLSASINISVTSNNTAGGATGAAFSAIPPTMLLTAYLKL